MLQHSTLKFLKDLRKNNNKAWFDAHRPQYDFARTDFLAFISTIIQKHSARDNDLKPIVPAKCLFRINRDIRFSKDKSPYKTNFGASMQKEGKKSGFAGYYFHCEPGKSFVGGGLWMPEAPAIKKVRQEIDYCWEEFKRIIHSKKFKIVYDDLYKGEDISLSKIPAGFEKENPAGEYLKLKCWIATKALTDKEITSDGLLKKTLEAFQILQPMLNFLNRALT